MSSLWLLPLGVVLGAFGTLIGAGGGFLLVPVLILLYPAEPQETLTSISLAVVFFNALSGSLAYARMRRIDYRSGALFAAATVPGAVIGAWTTGAMPRRTFDGILGVVLLLASGALFLRRRPAGRRDGERRPGRLVRTVIDSDGTRHTYSYDAALGVASSAVVGFVSSLLGIGGGIIHVPALVYLLGFPAHVATATSHFVLVFMALAGTLVHVWSGAFAHGVRRTAVLGVGVLIGAQIGSRLSRRVGGVWILRSLAVALGFVGVRILSQALLEG